jgi:hypothetical protein
MVGNSLPNRQETDLYVWAPVVLDAGCNLRGVAIDLLGESVFVSAVIIGQLSLDVPRWRNGHL